jgi:outer membrane cobalamin receptor
MILLIAYEVMGFVYGEGGKPLPSAVVLLRRLPDTSKAGGTYTDENGFFKIKDVKSGKYLLIIKFVGHEDQRVEFEVKDGDVDLGRIVLKESAIKVEEVEVRAQAPKITYEDGKRVIRFGEDIVSRGSPNVLEALKNVPGVNVDNEGNVRIRGEGNITLYINGKPTVLEVSDALRQIPASEVERIEIITNPSAKYEAEGGIIMNVVLKGRTGRGISANLSLRLGTFENYGLNGSLGITTGKTKFVFGANYFSFNNLMESTVNAEKPISYTASGQRSYQGKPYGARFSLEHNLTSRDILSFEGDIGSWRMLMSSNMKYSYANDSTSTKTDMGGLRGSLSGGYTRNMGNRRFEILAFYGFRRGREDTESRVGNSVIFKREGKPNFFRFSPQINYSMNFGEKRKLEVGYQLTVWNGLDSLKLSNPDTSGSYTFSSYVNGGYLTYSDVLGRFSYNLGLRVEDYRRNINDYAFKSTDLFPSLSLSFNPDIKNSFNLSYSRRTQRPMSWMLNPFIRKIDEKNYQKGNPNLKPSYTHSFEVGYQRVFNIATVGIEGFYRRNEGVFLMDMFASSYYDSTLKAIVITWDNLGIQTSTGAEFILNFQPFKFFKSDITLDIYNIRWYYGGRTSSSLSWEVKGNLNLMMLQISGNYQAPKKTARGTTSSSYSLDLGVMFPINRNIFFVGRFEDFLKLQKGTSTIDEENYNLETSYSSKWPRLSVMLIFDYNNFRKFQQRKKTIEEEEMPMF